MKKVFFGLAAISLIMLVTSCNNETVEVNTDLGNVLAFKAATGKQTLTRAKEVNLDDLEGLEDGLTVFSFRSDDNSLYNEYNIKYRDNKWTYGPLVFHPLTIDLHHFSVYPAIDVMNFNGTTATFDYEVSETESTGQVDLMVASTMTTPDNGRADLLFKHILTQVNFAIQGKENLIVQISDITLTNIKSKGTYSFDSGDWENWEGWNDLKDPIPYFYLLEGGSPVTTTPGDADGEIIYLGNKGGADSNDNTNSNALMLLPQTLDNAKLTFNFALFNKEKQDSPFDSGIASVNLSGLGEVYEWLEGRRYLYKLIFDPQLLEFYVVTVDEWTDADNGVIDVNTTNYE